MTDPRRRLRDPHFCEVALCPQGIHPGARMMLYKAERERLGKTEEKEPGTFGDHLESARAQEIDSALDRRLYALLATTTEIMRADVEDREDRILAAVDAYATTMRSDVPDLFAGRLAKTLVTMKRAADGPLSDSDVHAVVKAELAAVGLIPDAPSGGETMDFLKALTEKGQRALKYVLGDRDQAEYFKGTPEPVGNLVVGLIEKAAEWSERIDGLTADLKKARETKPTDPNSLESVLKACEDPGLRTYIETQDAALRKATSDFADFRKEQRTKELTELAKGWECLPNADGKLVAILQKADAAGFLPVLREILAAANEQAKVAKMFEELGIETTPGQGDAMTPQEADRALVAKATEIRKADPSISSEKAYEMALERNPDLYAATRRSAAAH